LFIDDSFAIIYGFYTFNRVFNSVKTIFALYQLGPSK